jgi:hypothetical protein
MAGSLEPTVFPFQEEIIAMKVLRGTFRLSIALAIVALLGSVVYAHFKALDAEYEDAKIWHTLQCGERFLDRDMSRFTNEAELIDIGKAGCDLEGKRFLATFDEIRKAVARPVPESPYGEVFWRMVNVMVFRVVALFVVVNLLGLVFLAARDTLRWVRAGYR